jgi:hypothetical protein
MRSIYFVPIAAILMATPAQPAALDRAGLMKELRLFAQASGTLLGALETCREFEQSRRLGRRAEAVLEIFLQPRGVRHMLAAMTVSSDRDIAAHEVCDFREIERLTERATSSAARLSDHLSALD